MGTKAPTCIITLLLLLALYTVPAQAKKEPPSQPIDLNVASLADLEHLPGIGEHTAKEIIHFRQKSGPFENVDDLLAIHGISKQRLDRIRPYVYVEARRKNARPSTLRPGGDSAASFQYAFTVENLQPLV